MTCTKKYALTEGPKRGGGGNKCAPLAQPPQSFYAWLLVTKGIISTDFERFYLCFAF